MIDTIYCEREIESHPRALEVFARFPNAHRVPIERYGEVFNRRKQNFRVQKANPSLILARKFDNWVLPTPAGFGIGGHRNYYFSHMLNCVYDCRYCFLQGMYQSAHYVLFINYEDFLPAIEAQVAQHVTETPYFFSGYDCDSLAFDDVSHFCDFFLPFFEKLPQSWLELRTKSVNTKPLLSRTALENAVVAFSLSPSALVSAVEHRTPPLHARITAMQRLAEAGWWIGLRFDPMIYYRDFARDYETLFTAIAAAVPRQRVHSISLGSLRFPKAMFNSVTKLYPEERLWAGPLERTGVLVSYAPSIEQQMMELGHQLCQNYFPTAPLFSCNTLA